jgi:hypothetical protein
MGFDDYVSEYLTTITTLILTDKLADMVLEDVTELYESSQKGQEGRN